MQIKGITVLNTFTQPIYGLEWTWLVIFALIIAVIGVILLCIGGIAYDEITYIGAIVFAIGFVLLYFATFHHQIGTEECYEITVDPSVSFTELYDDFEILEQRGNIYTVKLKEESK